MDASELGTVRVWNFDKGYGFIEPHEDDIYNDNGDLFVHVSALVGINYLEIGDEVKY
jgi:cold shock CspA family protein